MRDVTMQRVFQRVGEQLQLGFFPREFSGVPFSLVVLAALLERSWNLFGTVIGLEHFQTSSRNTLEARTRNQFSESGEVLTDQIQSPTSAHPGADILFDLGLQVTSAPLCAHVIHTPFKKGGADDRVKKT